MVIVVVVVVIGILGVWGVPIDLGGLGTSLEIKDKLSYTITLIIGGLTTFTFFRYKESAKVLEKVKFLNQKDLESYKIYNSKKKEFLLEFTDDLTECLYVLNRLDPVIKHIIDWGNVESDKIKYILQSYDIHEYDRKYLVGFFDMKKAEKSLTDERENFRKEFEMQLYAARWKKAYDLYEKAYRDMQEAKLFLINDTYEMASGFIANMDEYLKDCSPYMKFIVIKESHDSVFLSGHVKKQMKRLEELNKLYNEKLSNALKIEFEDFKIE